MPRTIPAASSGSGRSRRSLGLADLRTAHEFGRRVAHLHVLQIGDGEREQLAGRFHANGGHGAAIDFTQCALDAVDVVARLNERVPIGLLVRHARGHQLQMPGGIARELDAEVGLRDVGLFFRAGALGGRGRVLAACRAADCASSRRPSSLNVSASASQ